MANDGTKIRVGANGKVLVAPLGTTAPTDALMAWPAGWVELGFMNEDGVTLNRGQENNEIPVWQDYYAARRVSSTRSFEAQFVMREWSNASVKLAFGGGTVATTARTIWVANTAYTLNAFREPTVSNGRYYKVTTAGTSHATTEPTWPTSIGATVTDGTVTWTDQGPGSTVLHKYSPPDPSFIDERAMGVEYNDGGKIYRVVIPRGIVSENAETQLQRTEAADLPLTFAVLGTTGVDPFYFLSNDPAMANS